MELKTKKLTLRHVKKSDAQMLLDIEVDPENIKNMMFYSHSIDKVINDIKTQQNEYRKKKPQSEMIIIEKDNLPAGYVSIQGLNKPNYEHKAEISYALHPDFRGQGVTSEAVKKIIPYAQKKYGVVRIEAHCRTYNLASVEVLKTAGFELEGILRKEKKKNGKFIDEMIWSIVK